MSLIRKIAINTSYPFVGRAAGRSVVGTLNFTISNLAASEIRKRNIGVPVDSEVDLTPLQLKYGKTLDERNEADEATRGAEAEAKHHEEQGFASVIPPMEMAARLKVIRDSIAEDLDAHAQLLRNPHDPKKGTYKNPYDVAPSLEASFVRQISLQPRINVTLLQAQADALGLAYDDLLRVETRQQEAGLRFLQGNKDELMTMLNTLEATGPDGYAFKSADAEEVEEYLPAIQRARLYVAADRGLWYERDRCITMIRRGHPDGKTNMKLVDGARADIHAEFNRLMRQEEFRREIDEAVKRGATWPVLTELTITTTQK